MIAELLTERLKLAEEMAVMREKRNSSEKLEVWRLKNAHLLAEVEKIRSVSGKRQGQLEVSVAGEISLSSNDSGIEAEFLKAWATSLRDQMVMLNYAANRTETERQLAFKAWQGARSVDRSNLKDMAEQLAEKTAYADIPILDPPPAISGESKKFQSFLAERHALLTDRTALMNRVRSAPLEVRQRVIIEWKRQNAAKLAKTPDALDITERK